MKSLPLREEWRLPEAWPLLQSDTERALWDMAAEVPHQIDYDYYDKAFERMHQLRTDHLKDLLQVCTSYKVRRHFCVFAERREHPWWPNINVDHPYLGRGECTLAKVIGNRHPRFRITIPNEYIGPPQTINSSRRVTA